MRLSPSYLGYHQSFGGGESLIPTWLLIALGLPVVVALSGLVTLIVGFTRPRENRRKYFTIGAGALAGAIAVEGVLALWWLRR